MSGPKTTRNCTYAFGTAVWVKLLNRVWWPGIVVDPLTVPEELLEFVNNVEYIAVVKFGDNKYEVVMTHHPIFLYSCDRKIEFVEKGFSLYKNQQKGLPVVGNFDMDYFKKDVISIESRIGGDISIFENLVEKQENVKSIVKQFFTSTNTKKSKKKEVERKSLPVPKHSRTPINAPKFKPISRSRNITQSTGYSCQSLVGCNFTTNRYDNLKRHMAIHKDDTSVVTTEKPSTSSTSNKRKNLKTKSSEVKKQKLQEELLKDWDNDGEDEDEELNVSVVQLSSNVAQSSKEEVVQTVSEVQSSCNVQSSNEKVIHIMSDGQSSSNVVQSSNEEVVQTMGDVQSSSNVVQSSSISGEVIPISKVLSSGNDVTQTITENIPRNSELQETITSSSNQVFDFNENDNNTSVVELRQTKSDCSSNMDDDASETFESQMTSEFIHNTIFDAPLSKSLLVEKTTEDSIDKSEIQSNEIDNHTKSTELLLEKTVSTLDQINNFENSLSCISSSINNSDANTLTKDNNVVIGVSELSECESLNKTANLHKDIHIETNGIGIPLVENMSTETEDRAIIEESRNDKEVVSNDVEVNQLNGASIDKNMPIENSYSIDSTSNKVDCEDKITIKKEYLLDGIPNAEWGKNDEWEFTESALKADFATFEDTLFNPSIKDVEDEPTKLENFEFLSQIQETTQPQQQYILCTPIELFIPLKIYDKPYPRMEELTPDVNPTTEACQRASMENQFLSLQIIDRRT